MDKALVHYNLPAMLEPHPKGLAPARSLRAKAFGHLVVAVLVALAAAVLLARGGDLGLQGLLITGALALLCGVVLLAALPAALPGNRFGRANSVTLGRVALTCVLAGALAVGPIGTGTAWSLCLLAMLSLSLDGLDGWLARHYREATRFGARFDMEADALFLLVLAALVLDADKAGPWVLASGLWRYAFVALGLLLPRLPRSLPPSRRRKLAFVVQTFLLIACLAPPVEAPLSSLLAALGLAVLTLSFAVDLTWLVRQPRRTPSPDGAPR